MGRSNNKQRVTERKWSRTLIGISVFAVCYIVLYTLLLSFYNYITEPATVARSLTIYMPASIVVPCVASLITIFIGVAFRIIYSCLVSKIFLIASLATLLITFYNYLYFIILSRNIVVVIYPLFDLLSDGKHTIISLDLGQVSLLGIAYLCRHEILNFLRNKLAKSKHREFK